uniref:ATP synthase F0 subunit 8 n=1 Tax=Stenocranus matsumurai TaxID=1291382 RepID=A0A7S4YZ23_9HEMI|nr:ATP synthase F0 subunit 8 [Stenocranus matsumurai]
MPQMSPISWMNMLMYSFLLMNMLILILHFEKKNVN